jgi:2-dehydropantoate 2-reductase
MRILIVGAGAIGGYFGGRLAEAGQDVTFLVRPKRAAELASSGLVIRSHFGDLHIPRPAIVLAEDLHEPFDLVILSTKAYDFEAAIASFSPAVGSSTSVLPLLNGMRHLDVLKQRFGQARILGGQCFIGVTLNQNCEIVHLNEFHELSFGSNVEGTIQCPAEHNDRAGNVGEVGFHCLRGNYMPDARFSGRYSGGWRSLSRG